MTSANGLVIDSVSIDSTTRAINLGGPVTASTPTKLAFAGSRQKLSADITVNGQRWSASLSLLVSRWGGPELAAPSGRYKLQCGALAPGTTLPPLTLIPEVSNVDFVGATITLSAPLSPTERGDEQQARLEQVYRASTPQPLNAVFFESFYGNNVSCNPRAISDALAELHPDVDRYWSVTDASVSIPEGTIRLIEGSEEWWRIRAAARLIVVNDWLRNRYRRRRHQIVLQTWHGTPLKRIALGRPGIRLRPALATLRERSRWNIMLSQNAHSTQVFRRSYAFFGPIWQEGYPRDDVLVTGDRSVIRRRLGIADDVTVLLYAPTWRDDHPDQVDYLDVAKFTDQLGEKHVTLIRGHSRTLVPGSDVQADRVIDVTSYPDISELFLVADSLITDYSSVMFDYTVTGKPVFFYTPDLDHYRDQLRGFYFDLIADAPGPVARTLEELVQLVRATDAVRARYAPEYHAWQRRFNPKDDGRAAARVVQRLVRRGAIG
ncbi:MAG: hypothetical protein JWP30_964 [Homoserinimonas sp.]|jgi:CDP-glycerol glycerophosphotransferase|nr:hypothetical protein [Homoserinimonas sp.]